MRLGFIGLGHMGEPMATRLLDRSGGLTVWNRTPDAAHRLRGHGAVAADTPHRLLHGCDTVIVMLANIIAIEEVFGLADRDGPSLRGRVVVNMGTISPGESRGLGSKLAERGAEFVEAPVSGSRAQAEAGALVAMLAGRPQLLDTIEPVLAPLCRATFRCSEVPGALLTKLAVNTYLIGMVTALAESVRFAHAHHVHLNLLRQVLDAGPMASEVSRIKIDKLVDEDFTPQATVRDVGYNSRLILEAAAEAGITLPVLGECERLLADTAGRGDGELDMIAVLRALGTSVTRHEPEPIPDAT